MTSRRITEFLLLYVFVPAAYFAGWIPIPIIPVLIIMGGLSLPLLVCDPSFDRTRLAWKPHSLKPMLWLALAAALLMIGAVALLRPEHLFELPRQRPALWALVLVAYPLISVYPQELFYRALFIHRYGSLCGNTHLRILASAVVFGAHHAVMGNLAAVILSTLAGWRFAHTYERSRSVLVTALEHALYGWLVFTIGLGDLFYRGSINFLER